jgi:CheY-like chemotaxis protein
VEPDISELLLVEDNLSDVVVAMRAFRIKGIEHRVKVLRDGAEALEYLGIGGRGDAADPPPVPKVMLLDLRMPRVDGLAVLRFMRADERTRTVPIVIVSSSESQRDVDECYRLGANSFIVKKIDAKRPGEYLAEIAEYWLNLNRVAA